MFIAEVAEVIFMRSQEIAEYIFGYAIGQVVSVFYNRYPNSFATHVISEDVYSREINNRQIITRKIIIKEGAAFLRKAPRWMSRLTKVQQMPILEESVFDWKTGTLHTYTRNISNDITMLMEEKCTYRKMDNNRTSVKRMLSVHANHCSVFCGIVEKLLMKIFSKSTEKTLRGYNEKLTERFGVPKTFGNNFN